MSTNEQQEGGAVNFQPAETNVTETVASESSRPADGVAVVTSAVTKSDKSAVQGAALSSIDFSLWVTVDLSHPALLEGLEPSTIKAMKSATFPVRGGSDELMINLYDPFTSGRGKGEETSPVGIFRNALTGVLAVGAQLNNRALTYVGDEKKILQTVSALAGRMTQDLTRALEVSPKSAALPEDLVGFTSLSEFVNLSSWVSASTEDSAVGEISIYSNLAIAAPAIIDSKDPQKRIQRLLSTLERASSEVEDATPVYVAIAFDSASLFVNDRLHDLAVFLGDTLGFNVLTRNLVTRVSQDWLPSDKVDALFPASSDILFFRELSPAEEEDEDPDVQPEDAGETD